MLTCYLARLTSSVDRERLTARPLLLAAGASPEWLPLRASRSGSRIAHGHSPPIPPIRLSCRARADLPRGARVQEPTSGSSATLSAREFAAPSGPACGAAPGGTRLRGLRRASSRPDRCVVVGWLLMSLPVHGPMRLGVRRPLHIQRVEKARRYSRFRWEVGQFWRELGGSPPAGGWQEVGGSPGCPRFPRPKPMPAHAPCWASFS